MRRWNWCIALTLLACGNREASVHDSGEVADSVVVDGPDEGHPDGATECLIPGSLDSSFGTDGAVTIFGLHPPEVAVAVGVAIDLESRIVVAGGFTAGARSCVLTRMLPDGSRDTSFGANGVVRQSVGDHVCWFNDVEIQVDGKIVAFGEIDGHTNPRGVIGRYMPDGTLDTSFGERGIVVFDSSPITSGLRMTLDAQQRVLVVGDASNGDDEAHRYYARRYLPNGDLDPSFGAGGTAEQAFGNHNVSVAYNVGVQSEKIFVLGAVDAASVSAAGVVRYRDDGTRDATFASTGEVLLEFRVATGVAFDSLGRTIVSGGAERGGALTRLANDGTVDATFGDAGYVFDTDKPGLAFGTVELTDEQLVVLAVYKRTMPRVTVARYSHTGTRDTGFGVDGFGHELPLTPWHQAGWDLKIQADRRVVIVGSYGDLNSSDMFVARYCP